MANELEKLARKAIRMDYLQPIWQNLCNLYNNCDKCPLQEGGSNRYNCRINIAQM